MSTFLTSKFLIQTPHCHRGCRPLSLSLSAGSTVSNFSRCLSLCESRWRTNKWDNLTLWDGSSCYSNKSRHYGSRNIPLLQKKMRALPRHHLTQQEGEVSRISSWWPSPEREIQSMQQKDQGKLGPNRKSPYLIVSQGGRGRTPWPIRMGTNLINNGTLFTWSDIMYKSCNIQ